MFPTFPACIYLILKKAIMHHKVFIFCLLCFSSFFAFANESSSLEEDFSACANAQILQCNSPYSQRYKSDNNLNMSNYDLSGCTNPGVTYDGYEYVYKIDVGRTPGDITVSLTNTRYDMDVLVFSKCTYLYNTPKFSGCLGVSANRTPYSEFLNLSGVSGEIYIIVDGPHNLSNSDFQIHVTCNKSNSNPYYYSGSSCLDAQKLSCGDEIYLSRMANHTYSKDDYDISKCAHASFAYTGYDEVYVIDAGSDKKTLKVHLSQLTADVDMFLFKKCDDWAIKRFSDCVGLSYKGGTSAEEITVENASGEYILVVDGFADHVNSGFKLKVSCEVPRSYGNCYDADILRCGTSYWVDAPKHNNFDWNHYDLSHCYNGSYNYHGADHIYRVNATTRQSIEIQISGLHADLDLFVFEGCANGYNQLAFNRCKGYSAQGGRSNEKVIIDDAYGDYYVIVDSNDPWYRSGYEISVKCVTAPQSVCQYAVPLHCGDSKWVPAPHANQIDDASYDYRQCLGNTKYGYTGNDHVYQIDAGFGGKDLHIDVKGLLGDMDVLVFKDCYEGYGRHGLGSCVGYSISNGRSDEKVIVNDAQGVYYVVVDAKDAWERSSYEIEYTCYEPYQTSSCDDAHWITCGDEIWANAPTHNTMTTDHYNTSACSGVSDIYIGNDHLYEFYVGHRRDVTIELSGLYDDLDLLVFSACSDKTHELQLAGCVGYSGNGGSASEKVEIDDASGTYYIAVDSRKSYHRSTYKLKVDCRTSTPVYDDRDDDEDDETEDEDPVDDDPVTDDDSDEDDEDDETADGDEMDDDPMSSLICGGTIFGTTVDGTSSYDNEDISSCFESNLLYTGPDVLVPFEVTGSSFALVLTQADDNLSLFVLDSALNFLETGCRGFNYNVDGEISNTDNIGEVYSSSGDVYEGTYYALIEGYNKRVESDFSLTLTCDVDCGDADMISCQSSYEDLSGTSNQQMIYVAADDTQLVGYTGPEWRGSLELDQAQDISIFVHNIEGDGDLGVFISSTCGGSYIGAARSSGVDVTLETSLDSGSYVITIDGWSGAELTFDLEITGCADNEGAAIVSTTRSGDTYAGGSSLELVAYPNPFVDITRLDISSQEEGAAELRLLGIDGKLLTRSDITLEKGTTSMMLDGAVLGDYRGVVVYQVVLEDRVIQGRLIRLR